MCAMNINVADPKIWAPQMCNQKQNYDFIKNIHFILLERRKQDEMGIAYSTHGIEDECIQRLCRKPLSK
jgi:hypothetical protein